LPNAHVEFPNSVAFEENNIPSKPKKRPRRCTHWAVSPD
jgi:hypothetical protein